VWGEVEVRRNDSENEKEKNKAMPVEERGAQKDE
jgi:hypothetical protein